MTTATGDLSDRASLAKACKGIDVVVSAVQGGAEVIIEGQRNLRGDFGDLLSRQNSLRS